MREKNGKEEKQKLQSNDGNGMNAYTRNIRRFRFHQYTYTWTRDFIIESKLSAKFIEVLEIGNAINRTNRNWKFFHCMAVAYFYFSRSRFFFYSFVFVIASTIICAPSVWWWCVSGEYSKTTTATTTQVTIPRSVCYDWCNFLHSSALLPISLAYQMWTSMNNVITDLDKNWIYLFHAFILWYVQWSLFDAFQNSINKKNTQSENWMRWTFRFTILSINIGGDSIGTSAQSMHFPFVRRKNGLNIDKL